MYSNSETRNTYRQIWSGLWELVEEVTGEPIKFQFIHGSGIRGIVVDGSKPQIQGCGDALMARNDPKISGIDEDDPEKLVHYVVRLCMVHLERYVIDRRHHNMRTYALAAR